MDQVLSGGCLCDGTLPHHRRTRRGAETRSVDEATPLASGPPPRARACASVPETLAPPAGIRLCCAGAEPAPTVPSRFDL